MWPPAMSFYFRTRAENPCRDSLLGCICRVAACTPSSGLTCCIWLLAEPPWHWWTAAGPLWWRNWTVCSGCQEVPGQLRNLASRCKLAGTRSLHRSNQVSFQTPWSKRFCQDALAMLVSLWAPLELMILLVSFCPSQDSLFLEKMFSSQSMWTWGELPLWHMSPVFVFCSQFEFVWNKQWLQLLLRSRKRPPEPHCSQRYPVVLFLRPQSVSWCGVAFGATLSQFQLVFTGNKPLVFEQWRSRHRQWELQQPCVCLQCSWPGTSVLFLFAFPPRQNLWPGTF